MQDREAKIQQQERNGTFPQLLSDGLNVGALTLNEDEWFYFTFGLAHPVCQARRGRQMYPIYFPMYKSY